jgi:hypothetical protein
LLHVNVERIRKYELWKNRHGKRVSIDYIDASFEECWTETLEVALLARDLVPRDLLWNVGDAFQQNATAAEARGIIASTFGSSGRPFSV